MPSPTTKNKPTPLKPYTCRFDDQNTEDETLVVMWDEPQDTGGPIAREESFLVGDGGACLLETVNDVNFVPFEQLEACIRMGSLLAATGADGILLGTEEFKDIWIDQGTKHLQTIIGTVKVDTVVSHSGATPNPDGEIWDVTFKRGTGSDRQTITTDINTISCYKNGLNRYFFGAQCVPGWIKKEFPTYNKLNLDSTKRQNIIDALALREFKI